MKNRIIRNVDSILSFVLKLVMFFVWCGLTWIGGSISQTSTKCVKHMCQMSYSSWKNS